MGVFSRFTTFLKAKLNALLNRAENPNEVLDYSYEKQLEQLQNVRRSIADIVTSEKRLELQQADVHNQIGKLEIQAKQALGLGREDLARAVLERKQVLDSQLTTFDNSIGQLKSQQQKLIETEQQLASRVEQFRTQKEMVKAQYNAAQAQVKIGEAVSGLSNDMANVNLALEHAQNKVLDMQARANAMEQLSSEGVLETQLGSGGDYIDKQLQQISNNQAVENQLAVLKQQMHLEPAQPAAQLPEGPDKNMAQEEKENHQ